MKPDYDQLFGGRVGATKEEMREALKRVVYEWAENQLQDWNTPTLEDFVHEYPEWDHEALYATISEEIERTCAYAGDRLSVIGKTS